MSDTTSAILEPLVPADREKHIELLLKSGYGSKALLELDYSAISKEISSASDELSKMATEKVASSDILRSQDILQEARSLQRVLITRKQSRRDRWRGNISQLLRLSGAEGVMAAQRKTVGVVVNDDFVENGNG